jgi:hypothetical protein
MKGSAYLQWCSENLLEPDKFALTVYLMSSDWERDFEVWAEKHKCNKRWKFLSEQCHSHMDYRLQQAIDQA